MEALNLMKEVVARVKAALGCDQLAIIAGGIKQQDGKGTFAHFVDAADTDIPLHFLYSMMAETHMPTQTADVEQVLQTAQAEPSKFGAN